MYGLYVCTVALSLGVWRPGWRLGREREGATHVPRSGRTKLHTALALLRTCTRRMCPRDGAVLLWHAPGRQRAARMLRRKPTRIEPKPDDRDEYFAHKKEKQPESTDGKDKASDKDVRLGLVKPR